MRESIKLLIKTGSSNNSVEGIYEDKIKIKITAHAQKGKANKALLKYLSDMLDVPVSGIKIISGSFSNIKELTVKDKTRQEITDILLKNC